MRFYDIFVKYSAEPDNFSLSQNLFPLPQIAIPDVVEAAKDADILVFVLPHQFVRGICDKLKGKLKTSAVAVTLIKVGNAKIALSGLNA